MYCMYECMYVCMCVYVYGCICSECLYVRIDGLFVYLISYVCMYVCKYVCTVCMYVCMCNGVVRKNGELYSCIIFGMLKLLGLSWEHGSCSRSCCSSRGKEGVRERHGRLCMYVCMYVCMYGWQIVCIDR